MTPAGGVRRILAVFIDFLVFFALWITIGAFFSIGSFYYALGVLFLLDAALTALWGATPGRWLTGIRVARINGLKPGIRAALIRTAIVFLTGWAGLILVSLMLGVRKETESDRAMPSRMWWDAAAGTRIVRSGTA
jgi:uncharacterized RDD family membrane protein YckC